MRPEETPVAKSSDGGAGTLDDGTPTATEEGVFLSWAGRKGFRAAVPTPRVFVPVPEASDLTEEDPGNLVIEGDNRQAMVSLFAQYQGQVDVVVIDVSVEKAVAVSVEKAVAVADATYGALRHHHDVGSALVARAAATSDEGQAWQLLEQAVRWDRPRGDRTEFDSNLTTIGTALPPLDDLVNELRKQ